MTSDTLAARGMPERVHVRWGKSGDIRVTYMQERFIPPDNSADYILATPTALAASPEVAKLIREAEARGMERAADAAILQAEEDLAEEKRTDGHYTSTQGLRMFADAIRTEAAALKGAKL